MPNTPTTLQRPPPATKGKADKISVLDALPYINVTVHGMAVEWLLSKQSSDFVSCYECRIYTVHPVVLSRTLLTFLSLYTYSMEYLQYSMLWYCPEYVIQVFEMCLCVCYILCI